MAINVFPAATTSSAFMSAGGYLLTDLPVSGLTLQRTYTTTTTDITGLPDVVFVVMLSGGGGGGSGGNASGDNLGGGGGAGFNVGCAVVRRFTTVTIGAGGAGGAAISKNTDSNRYTEGSSGGVTSVNSYYYGISGGANYGNGGNYSSTYGGYTSFYGNTPNGIIVNGSSSSAMLDNYFSGGSAGKGGSYNSGTQPSAGTLGGLFGTQLSSTIGSLANPGVGRTGSGSGGGGYTGSVSGSAGAIGNPGGTGGNASGIGAGGGGGGHSNGANGTMHGAGGNGSSGAVLVYW